MTRAVDEHRLIVAVGAGMIVRPGDGGRVLVIKQVNTVGVVEMELIDLAQRAEYEDPSRLSKLSDEDWHMKMRKRGRRRG